MDKKAQALILGIMCLILTIGICLQIKTVNSNGSTVSSNQQINSLKDQVLKMKEKYESSYEKLEMAQQELEETRKNVTNDDNQLKTLEEEIKKDNLLLGTTEVSGQGVTITVTDGSSTNSISALYDPYSLIVHDTDLLAIVNELKNAGAEAIDINGQRIVNTTSILCDGNVIIVNGEKISSPFTINAIGLPERLETLNRSGGYLEVMQQAYIKTTLKKADKITIPKYIGDTSFKYAKTVK